MPTLHFKYGPRPDGEGYGIIAESAAINHADRDPLLKFCKAIRWRPEKRDLPDVFSIAVVPAPNVIWLCRIDETKDDQNRHLAYVLKAEGFSRSDSSAISQLRAKLTQQNDVNIANLEDIKIPTIIKHSDLLNYAQHGLPENRQTPSENRPPRLGKEPPRKPVSGSTAFINDSHEKQGLSMKSFALFVLGTIAGGILSIIWLWLSIIAPNKVELNETKTQIQQWEQSAKKHLPYVYSPDELSEGISQLQETVNQWEQSVKRHLPEVSNAANLSEHLEDLINRRNDYEYFMEQKLHEFTPDHWEQLRTMRESDSLTEALQQATQAIEALQEHLPTSENVKSHSDAEVGRADRQ